MRSFENPSELSPEQIRHELAGILAAGVLRLRKLRTETAAEIPVNSVSERLDVPRKTVLSVRSG